MITGRSFIPWDIFKLHKEKARESNKEEMTVHDDTDENMTTV